jgi:hypothetical protein
MIKSTKFFLMLLLIPTLIFILGCPNPEDEDTKPPAVTGLEITADADGDGVILTWNEVSDVDGYDVVTPDGDSIPLNYDETSYTDDTPSKTGTYKVYSVDGDKTSDPKTVSSAPYESTENATIYVWNSNDPSGFGWNTSTGIGTVYSCIAANKSVVDFFLNDESATFDFTSADQPPFSGDKTTGIVNMGSSDFPKAPESQSYYNTEAVVGGNFYAMWLDNNYFVKIHVTSATSGQEATFSYEFQLIKGLRIF